MRLETPKHRSFQLSTISLSLSKNSLSPSVSDFQVFIVSSSILIALSHSFSIKATCRPRAATPAVLVLPSLLSSTFATSAIARFLSPPHLPPISVALFAMVASSKSWKPLTLPLPLIPPSPSPPTLLPSPPAAFPFFSAPQQALAPVVPEISSMNSPPSSVARLPVRRRFRTPTPSTPLCSSRTICKP